MSSSNLEIAPILERLAGPDAERSWREFLSEYSDMIYGTVHRVAHNSDHVSDCFLFVCEKLAERDFRRLRAFKPHGPASFTTWLRTVVRNLSLDWYRAQFGRTRIMSSVASASALEQEIVRAVFEQKLSLTETWEKLRGRGTSIPFEVFEEKANAVRQLLTSREIWLLSTAARPMPEDRSASKPEIEEMADTAPNPETLAVLHQTHDRLSDAVRELSDSDRLLLRLRFDEDLGLREVAAVVGLKDAQTADRRIREALAKLREKLGILQPLSGKTRPASV